MKKHFVVLLFILPIMAFENQSCKKEIASVDYSNLNNLPKDTGGVQRAYFLNSSIEYGYYIYTPSGYEKNTANYPLLLFLHGSGEKGNSLNDTNSLKKVLVNGPPRLIKYKKWSPKYPMIVLTPQCHEGGWDGKKLHRFLTYIQTKYRINTLRIYLTGLSMGGYGTFSYLAATGDTSYIAAAVPICGGGSTNSASKMTTVPIWAFHGDSDGTVNVSNSINMITAINALKPIVKAKITVYPSVGHDSWSRTYDGSGMGTEKSDYDAFNTSIYDWMFSYTKNK